MNVTMDPATKSPDHAAPVHARISLGFYRKECNSSEGDKFIPKKNGWNTVRKTQSIRCWGERHGVRYEADSIIELAEKMDVSYFTLRKYKSNKKWNGSDYIWGLM